MGEKRQAGTRDCRPRCRSIGLLLGRSGQWKLVRVAGLAEGDRRRFGTMRQRLRGTGTQGTGRDGDEGLTKESRARSVPSFDVKWGRNGSRHARHDALMIGPCNLGQSGTNGREAVLKFSSTATTAGSVGTSLPSGETQGDLVRLA